MKRLVSALYAMPLLTGCGGSPEFDQADMCGWKENGEDCWVQIEGPADCRVWIPAMPEHITLIAIRWTGACTHGVFQGSGMETLVLSDGKIETPYVDGERHGVERWRHEDGHVIAEVPWVDGERHGVEIWLDTDGAVYAEVPWVDGERHGVEISRFPDGAMRQKIPWRDGVKHGVEIRRSIDPLMDDYTWEIPWLNGERHGVEIWRDADGNVIDREEWSHGEPIEVD